MIVKTKVIKKPSEVLSICWPKKAKKGFWNTAETTLFSVYDGHSLQDFYASDLNVMSEEILDFVFLSEQDPDYYFLMWRPISELTLWNDIREHDPEALEKLRSLMEQNR